MDSINIVPGSALHRLMSAVIPSTLPVVEAREPHDVIDFGARTASTAQASAPVAQGFVPFAAAMQGGGAEPAPVVVAAAPAAAPAAANNPTVLQMDDAVQQPQMSDERKTPMQQAKELNALLLQKITETASRSSAMTTAEVRDHLSLLGWASDRLEALSQQLEAQGKKDENDYVHGVQEDLAAAIDAFQQIHQGSVQSVQGAEAYRARVNSEISQDVFQTNIMNGQRRGGVIDYSIQMRSGFQGGGGMPGMMPGMMPGQMPGQMPLQVGSNFPLQIGQVGPNGMPVGPNGMPVGPNGMPFNNGYPSASGINLGPPMNPGAMNRYPNSYYR